jgi:TolB-like protein/DNA-binding winged helix-turn-helix (wHTH) protein
MADRRDLFLFHGFAFDQRGGGLFRRDQRGGLTPVPLGTRALDVLGALLERAGEPVTRDEIIAAVWPETVVEDNNLNMQIAALRRVIDDRAATASCIQTIPRRGYRFIAPVIRDRQRTPPSPEPADLPEPDRRAHPSTWNQGPIIWVAAALILLAGATAAWQTKSRWLLGVSAVPRSSIVVLPFANLGSDPAQQYFADGITDDLTTDLSRLADMLVISRDTAFAYKGEPVSAKRIRGELGVRYMLDGSIQRAGNQVRIDTQLVDTGTDTNLWAARFDRNISDLLAVQNEITGRIAVALNLKLVASEGARPTEHPDALDHIFRGRAAIYRPASRQNFAEAIADTRRNFAAQLNQFAHTIQQGDIVVLPRKVTNGVAIGKVTGEYLYNGADPYKHSRAVIWLKESVARDVFKQDMRHSFGAFMTICEIKRNEALRRVQAVIETGIDPGALVGQQVLL